MSRLGMSAIAATVVLLAGCAEPEVPERSVIGEPLHQALERAQGVDDLVQQQAEQTRRRIEESEGR